MTALGRVEAKDEIDERALPATGVAHQPNLLASSNRYRGVEEEILSFMVFKVDLAEVDGAALYLKSERPIGLRFSFDEKIGGMSTNPEILPEYNERAIERPNTLDEGGG